MIYTGISDTQRRKEEKRGRGREQNGKKRTDEWTMSVPMGSSGIDAVEICRSSLLTTTRWTREEEMKEEERKTDGETVKETPTVRPKVDDKRRSVQMEWMG